MFKLKTMCTLIFSLLKTAYDQQHQIKHLKIDLLGNLITIQSHKPDHNGQFSSSNFTLKFFMIEFIKVCFISWMNYL